MSRPTTQRGFTLVEVMIALAILSMGLVSLLVFTGNNVFQSARTAGEHVAVDLARGKMYDLEEELLTEGFQQLDQTLEGDFDDEGWPTYTWSATIEKIELPDMGALQRMGAAGAEGAAGEGGAVGEDGAAGSPLAGLLGMGVGGLGEVDPTTAGNNAVITGQFEIIRNVLEEAIRKITLTVTWPGAGQPLELVVSYYVTDPLAVNRVVPGSGGAGGEEDEDEGGGGDGGGTDGRGGQGPRDQRGGGNTGGGLGGRGQTR